MTSIAICASLALTTIASAAPPYSYAFHGEAGKALAAGAAAFAKACERSEVVPIGGHRMATHAPLIDEMR